MIIGIEIREARPSVGGAGLGDVGAYVWIDGVATGEIDPAHPANAMIAGIAAQARRRGARLLTRNVREFARVPGLVVEDGPRESCAAYRPRRPTAPTGCALAGGRLVSAAR